MAVVARLNYLRIAPRKTRLVVDLIRGKSVEEAQTILNFTIKKGAYPILKLLNSAVANAKNNFQLDKSNLYISKITVDEGPKFKRWRARARGRAAEILKRTSHLTLYLEEIVKKPKKEKAKKAKETKKAEPEVKGPVSETQEPREEIVVSKPEKPKLKPRTQIFKPKTGGVIRRIFRRKSF